MSSKSLPTYIFNAFLGILICFWPLLTSFKHLDRPQPHSQFLKARDALSLEKPELALQLLEGIADETLPSAEQITFHSLSALANKILSCPQSTQKHLELLKTLDNDSDSLAFIYYQCGVYEKVLEVSPRPEMKRLCQIQLARQALLDNQPEVALEKIKTLLQQESLPKKQQPLLELQAYSEWDSNQLEALQTTWGKLQSDASSRQELALRMAWIYLKNAEVLEGEAQKKLVAQSHALLEPLLHSEYAPEVRLCLATGIRLTNPSDGNRLTELLDEKKLSDPKKVAFSHLLLENANVVNDYSDIHFKAYFLTLEGHKKREEKDWEGAQNCYQLSAKMSKSEDMSLCNPFWIAECERCLGLEAESQRKFEEFYQKYPQHPLAAEALFKTQSLTSYLQGDTAALKRLRLLIKRYPESLAALDARFLMAHDKRQTRYEFKTKKTRFRNLPEAIEWYSQTEAAYDTLEAKKSIPEALKTYYNHLYFRTKLERAATHLEVAKESEGWKRKLTLDFAEEILRPLVQLADLHPEFVFDSAMLLAQVYELEQRFEEAEQLLTSFSDNNKLLPQESLALFQWNYQRAVLKYHRGDVSQALDYFVAAENQLPNHPNAEGTKLDLWLQQGICCRLLDQPERAMRLFSRIINTANANPYQAEALFQRALLFWETGSSALAIKQMERLVNDTGSTWSSLASQQLEIFYGSYD